MSSTYIIINPEYYSNMEYHLHKSEIFLKGFLIMTARVYVMWHAG